MKKFLTILTFFTFLFSGFSAGAVVDNSVENSGEEVLELATTEEDVAEITDDELTEAEPSELPELEVDEGLTQKFSGRMLLDVEGNGEVYYVDPVTGGKEYLADGSSAHNLLERRALGVSEANFEKLILGESKNDESVCDDSELGKRLRGRIVLRTEASGEAYWIYPENCRAYYAGTHEVAYELMKNFSLGMKKNDLARIKNNARQKLKTAFRFSVFAYAEDNNVDLSEAREILKEKSAAMKECMKNAGFSSNDIKKRDERIAQSKICANENSIPVLSEERKIEILETVKEVRIEKLENKIERLKDLDVKNVFQKLKNRRKEINEKKDIKK